MDLNQGDTIGGRYQIIRSIGEGGFSKTYLAEDCQQPSRTQCVVKQLHLRMVSSAIWQEAERRFNKEAIVLERLGTYAQIPQLLAYFQENQQFYLVQEFIEGEDLKQELKNTKTLNESEAIFLLQNVLEVLCFVHQQGVIHRDIKPSNLIRRKQDRKIVLIDFGVVKEIGTLSLDPKGQTILTQAVGTPGYMAPEQEKGKPNFSSDIYALGITVVEALTGSYPEEDLETEESIWQERAQVSQKLTTILNKMVCKDLKERYKSVTEVLNDLQPLTRINQTLVGQYKIIGYLGGGLFGNTYLAENLRRPYKPSCVIKQLKPRATDLLTLREVQRRFETEVAVLEKLGHHDLTPRILDHFQDNQEFYLVQEFIEGVELSKEIYEGKRWKEPQVKALLQDVLKTLAFIHQESIIHRDIKPSNLIRREQDGKIVLIDFGAVKEIVTMSANSRGQRSSTQQLGTEGYMPPEQRDGQPKFSSDFYALGITAIQALTGKSPEQFQKDKQTGEVIWHEGTQVSPKLARILDKMVRYDFRDRYQSATEILKMFRNFEAIKPFWKNKLKLKNFLWLLLIIISTIIPYQCSINQKEDELLKQANNLKIAGEYEKAISFYDQLIKLNPNDSRYWFNRGATLIQLTLYKDGQESCEKAIDINSNDASAWNCKAVAMQKLGKYDEAIAAHSQALKIDPKSSVFWNNKGDTLLEFNQPTEALANFEQAINIKPDYHLAWYNQGKALDQLKRYPEAIDAYDKAIHFKQDYHYAWLGRGKALRQLGKYEEAVAAYDKATRIARNDYEAWYERGLSLEKLERYQEALYSYSQAIQIQTNNQAAIEAKQRLLKRLK